MPEETPELPISPQEVQIQAPSLLDKIKIHKFKILGGVLGVFVLAGAVFGAYKLGQKQVQSGPQPTPTRGIVATPTPSPTANWEIYTNEEYGFSFRYPQDFTIEENLVPTSKYAQIIINKELKDSFTIKASKDYPPANVEYLLDTPSGGQRTIGDYVWKTFLLPKGYGDGPIPPSGPICGLQREEDNILYTIIFFDKTEPTAMQLQVVSTISFFGQGQNNETANWKTYTNTKYGYLIKYPEKWVLLAPEACIPNCPEAADNMSTLRPTETQYPEGDFIVTTWIKVGAESDQEKNKSAARSWNWQTSQEETVQIGGYEAWSIAGTTEWTNNKVYFRRYIVLETPRGLWEINVWDTQGRIYQQTFNLMLSTFKFLE